MLGPWAEVVEMQEDQSGSGDQSPEQAGSWSPLADDGTGRTPDSAVQRDGGEPAGHDSGTPQAPAAPEVPPAPQAWAAPGPAPAAEQPQAPAGEPGQPAEPQATYPLPGTYGQSGDYGQPGGYGQGGVGGQSGGYSQAGIPDQPGGYGQAAQPGGYGQTTQPGGYGQAAQPGGYGQPTPPGGYGQPGGYGPPGGYRGYGGYVPPPPGDYIQQGPSGPRRGRNLVTYVVVAALAAGVGAGTVLAVNHGNSAPSVAGQPFQQQRGSGFAPSGGLSNSAEIAIAKGVDPGLVDITSDLHYQGGTAEATGMIISSTGLVLTNNHVIDDSTGLAASLVAGGRKYQATVVGYDSSDDVALIKLQHASGLKTVPIGNSDTVKVGNAVVALGNADGEGGARAVTGSVTGLNQSITASDEGSATGSERLHGMLQTDANIVPGDSGGPLVNASGQVIGMDTAAATGTLGSQPDAGYAIPINRAVSITKMIEAGKGTGIKTGVSGFLGVIVPGQHAATSPSPRRQRALQLQQDSGFGNQAGNAQRCLASEQTMIIPNKIAPVKSGALIDGVFCNTPAETAGLGAGDVITSVNGHAVSSPVSLTNLMTQFGSGQQITIVWVDPSGRSHTSGVTLIGHPPA
jgi:S1-C subfamily serine protease